MCGGEEGEEERQTEGGIERRRGSQNFKELGMKVAKGKYLNVRGVGRDKTRIGRGRCKRRAKGRRKKMERRAGVKGTGRMRRQVGEGGGWTLNFCRRGGGNSRGRGRKAEQG